ncbi:MAG TPA: PIN domain-containing protein [Candidatus Eisenbacteria bacterium]|jgi:predicted nucleic acid-binding protein
MIAYLDSSVLLRVVLSQPRRLNEWKRITRGVASALVEVECLRTLDRVRIAERISDETMGPRREAVYRLIESMEIVEPSRPILARAAQPMPAALGTLAAIHLATVLLWRERTGADLVLATHDANFGLAARASGVRVMGA